MDDKLILNLVMLIALISYFNIIGEHSGKIISRPTKYEPKIIKVWLNKYYIYSYGIIFIYWCIYFILGNKWSIVEHWFGRMKKLFPVLGLTYNLDLNINAMVLFCAATLTNIQIKYEHNWRI